MGTKMGPSYSNLFVGYIEHKFFNQYTEVAERFETWRERGGRGHRTQSQAPTSSLLLVSKMSFALFVCTKKLLCNVYSVQCIRNRLMTKQEEAVV